MPIKRGSQHLVGYAIETVYGTTNTTPVLKELPVVSLNKTKSYATANSAQIRQHPFVSNVLRGMDSQTLEMTIELQPKNHDDLIANLFANVWTNNAIKAIDGIVGMTIESQLPTAFGVYNGCIVTRAEFTFTASEDAPIKVTLSIMAIAASLAQPASISSSAATAAVVTDPLVAGDSVFLAGGTAQPVSAVAFTLERTVDPFRILGSRRAREEVPGAFSVTGTFSIPYETTAQNTAAEAFTDTTLEVDAASYDQLSILKFVLPRVKRTQIAENIANRGAITQDYSFTGYYDPTSATAVSASRTYPN